MPYSAYSLPRVVAQQYILSSVHSEDADTVTYVATQKNMSREVLLCSLRASAAQDARKVRFFVETARTQARLEHPNIAAPLELLEADGSWHLAVERIKGEPLDMMVNSGRVLPAIVICGLLQQLCRVCIYLDIERIASIPFALQSTYLMDVGFRFDNMATAGPRQRQASKRYLSDASRLIEPILDLNSPLAQHLRRVMRHMQSVGTWRPLTTVAFGEELTRLQMEMLRIEAGEKALVSNAYTK
jgi:hypothetical protein